MLRIDTSRLNAGNMRLLVVGVNDKAKHESHFFRRGPLYR
jgi:hypothetical protein